MNEALAVLFGIIAGVSLGASGIHNLRKPNPGWFIATILAVVLTLLFAGVFRIIP